MARTVLDVILSVDLISDHIYCLAKSSGFCRYTLAEVEKRVLNHCFKNFDN